MLYAHARICSILRNAGVDMNELRRTGKIELAHPAEVALAMHILRFPEVCSGRWVLSWVTQLGS
jgi:arginyl-tRNA synthetase